MENYNLFNESDVDDYLFGRWNVVDLSGITTSKTMN